MGGEATFPERVPDGKDSVIPRRTVHQAPTMLRNDDGVAVRGGGGLVALGCGQAAEQLGETLTLADRRQAKTDRRG
jgi:hypothetical protein